MPPTLFRNFSPSSAHCLPSNILLFFFLLLQFLPFSGGVEGTLQHVQLFFRHGQRTPTTILTFPSEGVPSSDVSKLEKGELTNEGMQQEFALGQSLRSIYGEFLGERYRPREISVLSGRDNRTLASAQLLLAGLFPPWGDQVWNEKLLWQPIPVETQKILDHPSFGMFDHCPAEERRVVATEGYKRLEQKFRGEIAALERLTGMHIDGLKWLQKVLDTIITRAELDKMLPLPGWARQHGYVRERWQKRLELHEGLTDLFLEGMGGWHFDQILGRFDDFVGNRTAQKAVLYSGHDTNILTLGRFLGIEKVDSIFVKYSSVLAFELHSDGTGGGNGHFVEVKFRDGLKGSTLAPLQIAGCPSPCPLATFKSLRPRVSSIQWMRECLGVCLQNCGEDEQAGNCSGRCDLGCGTYGPIAAALLVLVVLLVASLVSVILSCRFYKRNYNQLSEENERSPLLISNRRMNGNEMGP